MHFHFTYYFIISLISTFSTLLLALYGARHLQVPGIKPFIGCLIIGAFWSLMQGFEFMGTELSTKMFFANMEYVVAPLAPVMWFFMVVCFIGRREWLSPGRITLLVLLPVLTSLLVWFDPLWGLVKHDFSLIEQSPFPVIGKEYGPWFWIIYGYGCLINGVSMLLLIKTMIDNKKAYRFQALFLLAGLSLIVISSTLYTLQIIRCFDITPLIFTVSIIITTIGIKRFNLFDLVPVTRNFIFEKMDTGIIIADQQMRIIDINETASMMLDLKNKRVIGQPLHAFLDSVPDHFPDTAMLTNEIHQKERLTNKLFRQIEIKKGFDITVLEIRASLLIDKRKNRRCWIVELRDVTGIQAAKKLLVEQHEELAIKTEQQRVARDLHDNMGQIISYTKIQLQSIQRELARNNTHKVNEQIERLKQVSDEAHEKLREYIFNLRQGEESHLSFRSLLNNMITESFQHSPVEFHVEIDDDTEVFLNDPNRKFHLISLTKEAITNSLKHSGATMITIGARKNQLCIDYYIRDNGRGISSHVMAQEKLSSWGLKLMKERAILTGGELQIMSLENKGITIRISYRGD